MHKETNLTKRRIMSVTLLSLCKIFDIVLVCAARYKVCACSIKSDILIARSQVMQTLPIVSNKNVGILKANVNTAKWMKHQTSNSYKTVL